MKMAQIKDEDTLKKVLDYCLDQEHFFDSKADAIREAWARAQQQVSFHAAFEFLQILSLIVYV